MIWSQISEIDSFRLNGDSWCIGFGRFIILLDFVDDVICLGLWIVWDVAAGLDWIVPISQLLNPP